MRRLSSIIFMAWASSAQTPPTAIQLTVPAPIAPSASVSLVGNTGNTGYVYYVIANYPSGTSVSQPAIIRNAPGTLTSSNFVNIGWQALTGISTYDVARVPLGQVFTSPCTCAVATGLTATSTTDKGSSLSMYTLGTAAVTANGSIYINNTNYAPPELRQIINGVDSPIGSGDVIGVTGVSPIVVTGSTNVVVSCPTCAAGAQVLPTINSTMTTMQAQAVINTGGTIYALAGAYTSGPFTFPNGGSLVCAGPYSTTFTYAGTGPFFAPATAAFNQQMNIKDCGLTLTNPAAVGIGMNGVWSSTISGNFITGGATSILMDGTSFGAYFNTVTANVIASATNGIVMTGGGGQFANNNTVSSNYISSVTAVGIHGVSGNCQGNYLYGNNVSSFAGTATIGIDYECVNGVLSGVNWVESVAMMGQTFTGIKLRNGGNNLSGNKYSMVASGGTVTQLDFLRTDPNVISEISTGTTPIYFIGDTTGFLPFLISSTGSSAYQMADTSLGTNSKYWETSVSASGICLTALEDDGVTALISPACWLQSGNMRQLGSINMGGVGQDTRYFANSADNTIQGDFGCFNSLGCIVETTTANNIVFRYNTSPVMTMVAGGLNVTGTVNASINFAVGATTVADSTSAIVVGGSSMACTSGDFLTQVLVSSRGVPSGTCTAGAGGTVTNVTASAPLTSSGGATPNISATYQGNGAKVQASTGSTTTDDCVKFDANGNTVDAGAACGTGTTTTICSGTVALGTSLIASGAAATTVTATCTGLASTDNIMLDFNGSPLAVTGYVPSANGMLAIIKWPSTNTINVSVVNNTSAGITPGAITLNYRVVR